MHVTKGNLCPLPKRVFHVVCSSHEVGLVLPYKRSSTSSWQDSMVAIWRGKETCCFFRCGGFAP
jgi:hypothetical protein